MVGSSILEYLDTFGHPLVPSSYVINGFKLGEWVSEQRRKNNKGIIKPKRFEKLKNVGSASFFLYRRDDGVSLVYSTPLGVTT